MALKIQERLYVMTRSGEREIQLCVGDITALPVEDTVDVILVSAYGGYYPKNPSYVTGALYERLGIDVDAMSKDMKWDLRSTFNCWLSHRLQNDVPYRYLLCFDVHFTDPFQAVQELFRAFMPIFNTQTKTVITPLLSTGGAGRDPVQMLKTIVSLTFDWMQMGLPLQVLKIVVYSPDLSKPDKMVTECTQAFSVLAKELRAKNAIPEDPAVLNDVFLITAKEDAEMKDFILRTLRTAKELCHVITPDDIEGHQDVWQHNVYIAMQSSAKVIPVLSSSFMKDSTCIDLYNIALCCNRQLNRDVLAPICIERLRDLPAYMGMVQWFDCRTGEQDAVGAACRQVMEQIEASTGHSHKQFDIFISYSHKKVIEAKMHLEALQTKIPEAKIFFDYNALKTGMAWQSTLYEAVENSRCVLVLLSQEYFDSSVCQEEFSIAMAKNSTQGNINIFLVCLEEMENKPFFKEHKPILAYEQGEDCVSMVTETVTSWLTKIAKNRKTSKGTRALDKQIARSREQFLKEIYTYDYGWIRTKEKQSINRRKNSKSSFSITVSYTSKDLKFVRLLEKILRKVAPYVNLHTDKTDTSGNKGVHDASVILLLLSPSYFQSRSQVEELHLILSRKRQLGDSLTLYTILESRLPAMPLYSHVIPVDTCLNDALWTRIIDDISGHPFSPEIEKVRGQIEEDYSKFQDDQVLGLLKCACDVKLLSESRKIPREWTGQGVFLNPALLTKSLTFVHSASVISSTPPQKKTLKKKFSVHGAGQDKSSLCSLL